MKNKTTLSGDKEILYTALIPYKYLYNIRLNHSSKRLISWLFIHLFPILYWILAGGCYMIYNAFNNYNASNNLGTCNVQFHYSIIFILSVLLFTFSHYYIYELGYILNDINAVKKDKVSLRLTTTQASAIQKNIRLIYITHFIPLILSLIILSISPIFRLFILKHYISASLLSLICHTCFCIYNNTKYNYRIIIYPILQILKYTTPLVLLLSIKPLVLSYNFILYETTFDSYISIIFILMIIIYPLEISIERFSMPTKRYKIIKKIIPDEESKKKFRVIYYFIISLITTIIYTAITINNIGIKQVGIIHYITNIILTLLPLYLFLLYRLLIKASKTKPSNDKMA